MNVVHKIDKCQTSENFWTTAELQPCYYITSHISILFSSGEDVQRASVIINLPILVRQNPAETFRRVGAKSQGRQKQYSFITFCC